MVVIINTDTRKWYKKLFGKKKSIDTFWVYYREDGLDVLIDFYTLSSNYLDGLIKLTGEYQYNKEKRTITNISTGEIIKINSLSKIKTSMWDPNNNNGIYFSINNNYALDGSDYISINTNNTYVTVNIKLDIDDDQLIERNRYLIYVKYGIRSYRREDNSKWLEVIGIYYIDFFTGELIEENYVKERGLTSLEVLKSELENTEELPKDIKEEYEYTKMIEKEIWDSRISRLIYEQKDKDNSNIYIISKVPESYLIRNGAKLIEDEGIINKLRINLEKENSLVDLGVWKVHEDSKTVINENGILELMHELENTTVRID